MLGRLRVAIYIMITMLAIFVVGPIFGGSASTVHAFAKLAFENIEQLLPYEPQISGTTFVAAADLVTVVGGTVTVDGDEVTVRVGQRWATFQADAKIAVVDDNEVELAVPARWSEQGMMVPLGTLADVMGVLVSWESPYLILRPRATQAIRLFPEEDEPADALVDEPPDAAADESVIEPAAGPVGDGSIDEPTEALPEDEEQPSEEALAQTQTDGMWEPFVSLPTQVRIAGNVAATMQGLPQRQSLSIRSSDANRLRLPRDIPFQPPEIIRASRVHEIAVIWRGSDVGSREIHIEASHPFTIDAFLMEMPSQLVLDLHGLDTGNAPAPMYVKDANVRAIRLGQYTPDTVRVVAEMEHVVGYHIETSPDQRQATVRIYHALSEIRAEFSASGGALHLDIPSGAVVEMLRLSDPDRIAIDLPETTLVGPERRIQGDGGPVEYIWASRHARDRTRITLYVERYLDLVVDRSGDTLSFQAAHRIEDVAYGEFDFGFVAVFQGVKLPEPRLMYLMADSVHKERLVVDFSGTVLIPGANGQRVDSELVRQLRIGQDTNRTRFVFDLWGKVDYFVVPLGEATGYAVVAQYPALSGTSVMIDPGHGGKYSGAVGAVLGVLEKDVNLDVALKLGRFLEASDAEVYYSRTTDTALDSVLSRDLALRQEMATQRGVDLFVSIHANSVDGNPDGAGTETFIHSSVVHPDAIRLAAAVQRELVAAGGRADRGVKQANFRVIRNDVVPSILVELAFLSNAEEERLLNDPDFRERLAQGIFHGIVSYVREKTIEGEIEDIDKINKYQAMIENALASETFYYLSVNEGEVNADGP